MIIKTEMKNDFNKTKNLNFISLLAINAFINELVYTKNYGLLLFDK